MFEGAAGKNCSPELLAKIADLVDSAVIISQKGDLGAYDHKIIYANNAFCELSGYSQAEVLGRSPDFLCDQRSNPEGMLEFYKSCHFNQEFRTELQSFSRDGAGYSADIHVSPAGDFNGSYFIIMFSNVQEEIEESVELDDFIEKHPFVSQTEIIREQPWQHVEPQPQEEIQEEEEFEEEEQISAEDNTSYDSILEEIAAELKTDKNEEDSTPDVEFDEEEIDLDSFEDEDDLKEEYKLDTPEVAEGSVQEDGQDDEFFSQLDEMLETKSEEGAEEKVETAAAQAELKAEISEPINALEDTEIPELSSATGQIAELLRSIEKRKAEAIEQNEEVNRAREESVEPETVHGELNNYATSQFMSNMSHDLRTPLNAIIGFSEVIRDQLFGPIDNPRYTSYANDIYKSGQELLATVSEILELSEIEEEDATLEEETFSLSGTLDEVLDLLSARAFQCDVKIMKKLHAEDIACNGDRKKIKQAFAGIISNAIKCSPSGGNLEMHSDINEDGEFQLMVYIKSANMIAAKSNLGSLLGTVTSKIESEYPEIMIAHKFIEAHGGEFSIFNSATSGTEISVTIPKDRVSRDASEKSYLKVIN